MQFNSIKANKVDIELAEKSPKTTTTSDGFILVLVK